jgi:3-oxoacyl-[acyl-carrier-protein] synthase III
MNDGNATFTHSDTAIVSVEAVHAPEIVTSAAFDEQLMSTYERLGTRPGLLENLAGIRERRWWPEGYTFTDAAAEAGAKAIAASGVDKDRIGLLIDTSVCRDRLEPSAAVTVHQLLDLPSHCTNFDLANACLGFMNAVQLAGTMIDSGQIDYALVVDGEGSRHTQEMTIERLLRPETTADDLFLEFATLTLGSGGAAMVLGRASDHPGGHRVIGGISRADTSSHTLCIGTIDQMRTDTKGLLDAGLDLAKRAWTGVEERGWYDMDRYIIHQVSSVHTSMMCAQLGIDPAKAPLTFPTLGNVGPASIPITLAGEQDSLETGDRVLCLGIGSGMNVSATELLW